VCGPAAELVFQLADLPAQRRLRDTQRGGGAAEVAMVGHRNEVPHQPQVKVDRSRCVVHTRIVTVAIGANMADSLDELR
jgi:hypothetical protein